jgi:hypothetical protein
MASALGKEATFAECLLLVHSAKVLTKGPVGDLVAECLSGGHSAKRKTICRVSPSTLGKGSVALTSPRDGDFSLPSTW